MRQLRLAGLRARGDQDYAVTFGLRMLLSRHLLTARNGLFQAVPAELPLLRYYANAITPGDGVDGTVKSPTRA